MREPDTSLSPSNTMKVNFDPSRAGKIEGTKEEMSSSGSTFVAPAPVPPPPMIAKQSKETNVSNWLLVIFKIRITFFFLISFSVNFCQEYTLRNVKKCADYF